MPHLQPTDAARRRVVDDVPRRRVKGVVRRGRTPESGVVPVERGGLEAGMTDPTFPEPLPGQVPPGEHPPGPEQPSPSEPFPASPDEPPSPWPEEPLAP